MLTVEIHGDVSVNASKICCCVRCSCLKLRWSTNRQLFWPWSWSWCTLFCDTPTGPSHRVQELCESRDGHPGLSVLTSLTVSMDVLVSPWPKYVNRHPRTLSNTTAAAGGPSLRGSTRCFRGSERFCVVKLSTVLLLTISCSKSKLFLPMIVLGKKDICWQQFLLDLLNNSVSCFVLSYVVYHCNYLLSWSPLGFQVWSVFWNLWLSKSENLCGRSQPSDCREEKS